MSSKSIQHLQIINIQDEYGTPKKELKNFCKEQKLNLKIDIAASFENHVLKNYIDRADNCFNYEIKSDFYMNPPYSEVSKFMAFAYEQHKKNNVNALILTYSKTDTKWWHEFVEGKAKVHFIKGRLKFLDENGVVPKRCEKCKLSVKYLKGEIPTCSKCHDTKKLKENSAPYPSVWILYRSKK